MQLNKILLDFMSGNNVTELVTLLAILLGLSAVFWVLIGRFRLHNFLINIYIAFAVVQVVPKDTMSFMKNSSILLFLILLIILTLINKYLFDIHQYGSGLALWQVLLVSFFEVALLLSIILPILPTKDILQYISKNSLNYFTDPWWRVGWMIAPLVFLAFMKKRSI